MEKLGRLMDKRYMFEFNPCPYLLKYMILWSHLQSGISRTVYLNPG